MANLLRCWLNQEIPRALDGLLKGLDDNHSKDATFEEAKVYNLPTEYWESPANIAVDIRVRGNKTVQLCKFNDYGPRPDEEEQRPISVRLCDSDFYVDAILDKKFQEKFEKRKKRRFTKLQPGTILIVRFMSLEILGGCKASFDDGITYSEQKYAAGGKKGPDIFWPRKRLDDDETIMYRKPSFIDGLKLWLPPNFVAQSATAKHIRLVIHEMDVAGEGIGVTIGEPHHISSDDKVSERMSHLPMIAYNFPEKAEWEALWFKLLAKFFLEMGWSNIDKALTNIKQYRIEDVRETFEDVYPATGFAEYLTEEGFIKDFQKTVSADFFPTNKIYQIIDAFRVLQLLAPSKTYGKNDQKRAAPTTDEDGPPRKVAKIGHQETPLATQFDLLTQFNSVDWDDDSQPTQQPQTFEPSKLISAINAIVPKYDSFAKEQCAGMLKMLFRLALEKQGRDNFSSAIREHNKALLRRIFWDFVGDTLPQSEKPNKATPGSNRSSVRRESQGSTSRGSKSQKAKSRESKSHEPEPVFTDKKPSRVAPASRKTLSPSPAQRDDDDNSGPSAESDSEDEEQEAARPLFPRIPDSVKNLRHTIDGLQKKIRFAMMSCNSGTDGPLPLFKVPADQLARLKRNDAFYPGINTKLERKIRQQKRALEREGKNDTPVESEDTTDVDRKDKKKAGDKPAQPTQEAFTISGPTPAESSEEEKLPWSPSPDYKKSNNDTDDQGTDAATKDSAEDDGQENVDDARDDSDAEESAEDGEDDDANKGVPGSSRDFIDNSPPVSSMPRDTAAASSQAGPPERKVPISYKKAPKAAMAIGYKYEESDEDDEEEAGGETHVPASEPPTPIQRFEPEELREDGVDNAEVAATAPQAGGEQEGISLDDEHPSIPETQLSPEDEAVNNSITSSPRTMTGSPKDVEQENAAAAAQDNGATDDQGPFSTPPEKIAKKSATPVPGASMGSAPTDIASTLGPTTIQTGSLQKPILTESNNNSGRETFAEDFETVPEMSIRKASSETGLSWKSQSQSQRASRNRRGRHSLDGDHHNRDRSASPTPRFEKGKEKKKAESSSARGLWHNVLGVNKPKNKDEYRAMTKMDKDPVYVDLSKMLDKERKKYFG